MTWDLTGRQLGAREGPAMSCPNLAVHPGNVKAWRAGMKSSPCGNPPRRLGSSQKNVLIEFQIIGLASARVY